MNSLKKIVVIGCSGAGAMAAKMAKTLDPSLEVTIIREQEEKGLLTRCATPYIASGNVMVDPSYKDDAVFTNQGIKLVNVKAVGIDRKLKTVTTQDGTKYPYDKLVLATGAKPIVFPISGVDLAGVFTLRTSGDAVNILNWINSKRVKNVVVIGAGAIGIEIAYLISQHGKQKSMSKHSMMREKKPYTVKLIFDRRSKKLIGGQIVSLDPSPVKHIDVIAIAIRSGLTVLDLTTLRCAGQPELSSDPGMEPISLAAEKAFKIMRKDKEK